MKKENLIQRLSFDFALSAIALYKVLLQEKEFIISKQFVRSATSIGANIVESEAAQSKNDFIHKMSIASKEARETKYWLLLLERSQLVQLDYTSYLQQIDSIINILTAIIKTSQTK
ncbi:MAG: four helix bundle protein [Flectobacillus sp.]|jgi:four helix bundle protein|nr:four helix bundle protein [Flectobacillus sp.]